MIGNHLGKFLHVEEETLMGVDKIVGHFLVELDMPRGLLDKKFIEWCGRSFAQTLDYWGIPFHYSKCREVRYL